MCSFKSYAYVGRKHHCRYASPNRVGTRKRDSPSIGGPQNSPACGEPRRRLEGAVAWDGRGADASGSLGRAGSSVRDTDRNHLKSGFASPIFFLRDLAKSLNDLSVFWIFFGKFIYLH